MAIFKCKMCGGNLEIQEGVTVATCEYCGTQQTVPAADNEKKLTLFARANRLRSACEFDKASGVFESIVVDFPEEAEAYWGLVLCKFGIEYVDDPATGKKIPTCHRSSFDSIMDDGNFEQTLENADELARKVYREEAKVIEEIRKGIIEVSSKEDPYDIFICYKETDSKGERTIDSVLAQDVYDSLTEKGYRVFFARISLEDKLGQEYEPYIFAALNSAKVMLVFGTDYEYFNAVWVKNEWARFLELVAKDKSRHLIPCFKGIDAYDMPKEFAHLQAQDMGKVGAVQDLLRGIKKILGGNESKATVATNETVNSIQKVYQLLIEEKWEPAKHLLNSIMVSDSDNAEALLGLLMAENHVQEEKDLADFTTPLEEMELFKQAFELAEPKLKKRLKEYNYSSICNYCKELAKSKKIKDLQTAVSKLKKISEWKESEDLYKAAKTAIRKKKAQKITTICASFVAVVTLCSYIAIAYVIPSQRYDEAFALYEAGNYELALQKFSALGDYKNAKGAATKLSYLANYEQMVPGKNLTFGGIKWHIASRGDGKVLLISTKTVTAPFDKNARKNITWKDSTLRAMLNGSFYDETFSEDEKALIQTTSLITNGEETEDKIFIFSEKELTGQLLTYFKSLDDMEQYYMLRDVGDDNSRLVKTFKALTHSVSYGADYKDTELPLRPAMYLDFNITKE